LLFVAVVVAGILLGLALSRRPTLELNWIKTGGSEGLNESLEVLKDGKTTWEDNKAGKSTSWILSKEERRTLLRAARAFAEGAVQEEYAPREDAADWVSYQLTVRLDGKTRAVKWVDGTAAKSEIPGPLSQIQSLIELMIDQHRGI
jgi:hypothetical protein